MRLGCCIVLRQLRNKISGGLKNSVDSNESNGFFTPSENIVNFLFLKITDSVNQLLIAINNSLEGLFACHY